MRFRFYDRILRPVQEGAAEIRLLSRLGRRRLLRLVAGASGCLRIHFAGKRIHRQELESIFGFHHSMPLKWIERVWVSRGAQRRRAVIKEILQQPNRAAMFEIARPPKRDHEKQGGNGGAASAKLPAPAG